MTVGTADAHEPRLLTLRSEVDGDDGEPNVELSEQRGLIHADLKVGANVAAAQSLRANALISNRGVIPHGAGFIVTREEARLLGLGTVPGIEAHLREYRNGRDLTDRPRGVLVIDLHSLDIADVRRLYPAIFQWLLDRVKPERDQNRDRGIRENWWKHARARGDFRPALDSLRRYIATGQVAKHRVFQWLDASILPDDKLIAIASDEAAYLGALSSIVHTAWALVAGGRLGVGNDPVYSKSTCFETFPFPHDDTGLTPALTERVRQLAEQIDAHRKARQAAHDGVTLTGLYNVLAKLRSGEALMAKDKLLHEQGLVGVLRSLHDDLDAAVLAAYGWGDLHPALADHMPAAATPRAAGVGAQERLVALNAKRAAEEAAGTVRWLRPEFQQPQAVAAVQGAAVGGTQAGLDIEPEAVDAAEGSEPGDGSGTALTPAVPVTKRPWPTGLPEQIKAVAELLSAHPLPLSAPDIEARFTARGRWRERLPTILDTLEALGRARRVEGEAVRWQAG